jgi:hypothetical protein
MHSRAREFTSGFALAAAIALAGTAYAATPPNDDCINATAITGNGPFNFDTTSATVGTTGVTAPQCDGPIAGIGGDVWYCWTATCNGFVEISTCGQTQVDTKIRIYDGCTCPGDVGNPICCGDDECGKQTKVICDAVCGHTYLIQIGSKFAGTPGGTGTFTVTCVEETCPNTGGGDPTDCGCCGERPPLVATLTTPFNPGLLAATTNFQTSANLPAVYLVDLGNQGSAPLGTNWTTQRYSAPDWTMQKLGGVFGVTLDNGGNVYVAHTSVYGQMGSDPLGSLGGAGSIYVLNGTSGSAAELVRLPNQIDPAIAATDPQQAYPGLGNLTFGCDSGRLYAANLEDGRIYSIDPANAGQPVRDTFDITTNAITGPLPTNNLGEPGDAPGWVPLRERPYAVKVHGGRLFYSVWNSTAGYGGPPNEIWSVGLTAGGDFVPNSKALELVLPVLPGYTNSNPVVDITFDDQCCMLVAERGLTELYTFAHNSRVMKFCQGADGTWGGQFDYTIGDPCIGPYNSAGGVGFEPGANNVWSMGDALKLCSNPITYGLQGQPAAGAPTASSILVDIDGITTQTQKNELGSLEVNCLTAAHCMDVHTDEILCRKGGDFVWTFTVTNLSGQTAAVLILPDQDTNPHVIPFNPPLGNGSSTQVSVTISGQQPGTQFCFDMIFGSVEGNECCHIQHCIDLPDCECAQTSNVELVATTTPGVFNLFFQITNLEAWNMGHVTLFPSGTTGSVSPSLWNFPNVPQYGSTTIGPVLVTSGMAPGDVFCITMGQHSQNWLTCCFIELCVTVPNPAPSCIPPDLNCDGSVDAQDLAILLGAWGSSGPGDLDADGIVNAADLAILLGAWGT